MTYLVLGEDGEYYECGPDETATDVFLKDSEYKDLIDPGMADIRIRACQQHDFDLKDDEEKIKKEIEAKEARIKALRADMKEETAAMHELEYEISNVRAENANLIRMVKEKANQMRNLKPKKGHPGYVVTRQDEETNVVGHDGFGNPIELRGLKTTIETPYNIDIPIELIEEIVIYELAQALRGNIGIYKGRYMDVPEAARAGNVVYNYDFHANIYDKNHLWTICLHSPYQIEIKDGKKEVEDEDGKEEVEDGVEEVEDGKEEIEDGKEDE